MLLKLPQLQGILGLRLEMLTLAFRILCSLNELGILNDSSENQVVMEFSVCWKCPQNFSMHLKKITTLFLKPEFFQWCLPTF